MNTSLVVGILICSSIFLTGCSPKTSVSSPTTKEKSAVNTTITGTLIPMGSGYAIKDAQGKVTAIDSYELHFDQLRDKEVSLTGQFSGITLFVDKVEVLR